MGAAVDSMCGTSAAFICQLRCPPGFEGLALTAEPGTLWTRTVLKAKMVLVVFKGFQYHLKNSPCMHSQTSLNLVRWVFPFVDALSTSKAPLIYRGRRSGVRTSRHSASPSFPLWDP